MGRAGTVPNRSATKQTIAGRATPRWLALTLGLCLLYPAARPAGAQETARPIALAQEPLDLTASTVAASADGRRVYLGRQYSRDAARRNLGVVTIDAAGRAVGPPRWFADSVTPQPNPRNPAQDTVQVILPDTPNRKLYLGTGLNVAPVPDGRLLTVYDTDAAGEPVGPPRTYEMGNPNKAIGALALNPAKHLLYMVGWGGAGVYVYHLDGKGEPQGKPVEYPVGGQGKFEVALSTDGKRLYLGTYPDALEVVDLDAEGLPTGKPRRFVAEHFAKTPSYLRFQLAPRAVYMVRTTEAGPRLAVWPLDETGDPEGEPEVREDIQATAISVDNAHRRLWLAQPDGFTDTFNGKYIVQGVRPAALPLDADGHLAAAAQATVYDSMLRSESRAFAVAQGGTPVLVTGQLPRGFLGNRVKDWRIRVAVLKAATAAGEEPGEMELRVALGVSGVAQNESLGLVYAGGRTKWVNLDKGLKNTAGSVLVNVSAPARVTSMQLRIELAEGDPANGGTLLKTMTDEVMGNNVLALFPGYGYEPVPQRLAAIELFSDHAKKFLAEARAVGLKPEERPRQFVVSSYQLMGGQGHVEQLKNEAETVSRLGINTTIPYWWGAIPPAQIKATLDAYGLQRRGMAIYNPPSYFDFERDKMNPAALDTWVSKSFSVAASGARPGDVVDVKLADEPGWYFPALTKTLAENAAGLEVFRTYLKDQGLKPADVGKASWDKVFPLNASGATDLPARRLFYWTMRFFPESAAKAHKLAREAIQRGYPNAKFVDVNFNNWLSRWYIASPGAKLANNSDTSPDAAMGMMDWFENGRTGAHTLWSEDWFGDREAQTWSVYADALRSAAMLGNTNFGGYVVGQSTGGMPEGASYKVLSLMGHGAKMVDFYTFGPLYLFGDSWSDGLNRYRPIANALRRLGKAERLMYPGVPQRGKVAILIPGSSSLWESKSRAPLYEEEISSLHFALVHAGYTVDYVDEKDLAGAAWRARGYTTLYVCGPNVLRTAQDGIRAWVQAGGTLVALPGAATADEYNTPTAILDEVLQVSPRGPIRDSVPTAQDVQNDTATLQLADARLGAGAPIVHGTKLPLKATTAKILASFSSGGAAITAAQFGKGRALAFGFYPGYQYSLSADRTDATRLPEGWSPQWRKIAVAPAAIAATPRAVTLGQEQVEACRLESAKGIAVVLLNWTNQPITELSIAVPGTFKFTKVSSIENGPLKGDFAGGTLKLKMPLKTVDVLMIE